ncbi:MAG: N-acetyltransferase [Nitrospirae bacterium]|nr:N-acetyltransferase [Nitrospirota bacterium]
MIRSATAADIPKIHRLIQEASSVRQVLPRTPDDITKDLPTFLVVTNRSRKLIGTCSLKIYSPELCEVRSLVVDRAHRGQDLGIKLLRRCIRQARRLGFRRLFALAYHPQFFARAGFRAVEKMTLPQKVWRDCIYCERFKDCREVALIRDL